MEPITIRFANASDAAALATREVVADPFRHTAELCEVLRCAARPRRVAGSRLAATRARPRAAWAST